MHRQSTLARTRQVHVVAFPDPICLRKNANFAAFPVIQLACTHAGLSHSSWPGDGVKASFRSRLISWPLGYMTRDMTYQARLLLPALMRALFSVVWFRVELGTTGILASQGPALTLSQPLTLGQPALGKLRARRKALGRPRVFRPTLNFRRVFRPAFGVPRVRARPWLAEGQWPAEGQSRPLAGPGFSGPGFSASPSTF